MVKMKIKMKVKVKRSYLIYSIALIYLSFLALAILTFRIALISLGIISTLILFLSLKFEDTIKFIVFKNLNLTPTFWDYRINLNEYALVTKSNSNYTAFSVGHFVFNSDENFNINNLEEIIGSTNFPFRFIINVEKLDKSNMLNSIRTKKRFKEIELYRTNKGNTDKINRLKNQIELISKDLDQILKGNPLLLKYYIVVYGESGDEFKAIENSKSNLLKIGSLFASTFKCEFYRDEGASLINFLNYDEMVG